MSFKELNTRLINIVGHDRFARNGTIDVADKYPDTLSNKGRCNSSYRTMAGKSFLSNFLIGATMLGASLGLINEVKAEPSKPIQPLHELVMQTPTVPDTVYTKAVTAKVFLDGFTYEGAQINYTLLDTVNNTQLLVRTAFTNANGEDLIDSLPILKHYTGLEENEFVANKNLIVTNNGTGSNHLMRFKTDAKSVPKEGYIFNALGQQIATLKLDYNPSTEIYDAVWNGENLPTGLYTFLAKTSNGIISEKILHLKNAPSQIDYNAGFEKLNEPAESDNNTKSGREVTDDLAASKYANAISDPNLETLLDTVLLKEDTYHDLIYNVTGKTLGDGNVTAWIYFEDLSGQPTNANVEYKRLLNQSEIYTTTAPSGFYQITVPVVFEQQNPDTTKYLVTLSSNTNEFITKIDTLSAIVGPQFVDHFVNQILPPDATLDIEGIVRNVYTKLPESGVTIRLINRTTGLLVDEQITDANGAYEFLNREQGELLETELGKSGEFWLTNKEIDVPTAITDTVLVQNRYFYPSTVEVPEVGANSTFQGDGEEAAEMVGYDYINFEEILRDTDLMWANGPTSSYWSARTWIQNNFYEGTSPITTANTQRNITNTMQGNYEPYTNFYAGQLGWNVDFGSGNLTIPLNATTTYGVFAIIGGEIMTTGGLEEYIKELQGRRLFLGTVNSRLSMMNANPAMPDNKDRAYVYMILINQKGRFSLDEETYNLTDLTSNAPTMRANEGQGVYGKETPLPTADYVDIEGSKPHSKSHFNQEKFQQQQHHQRQEQIKSYLIQQLSK